MTTQFEPNLDDLRLSLPLRWSTPDHWTSEVLLNVNSFLADHASCERKASAAALMLANKFPEHPALQDRMIKLAIEELQHFHQVFQILTARGISLPNDETDDYVKHLLRHVRHPRQEHLLDRLLVAAMVEARSCERFCLFAKALPEGFLKEFYADFAQAESAHYPLFVKTAELFYPSDTVSTRLDQWLQIEADIAKAIPLRASVH